MLPSGKPGKEGRRMCTGSLPKQFLRAARGFFFGPHAASRRAGWGAREPHRRTAQSLAVIP